MSPDVDAGSDLSPISVPTLLKVNAVDEFERHLILEPEDIPPTMQNSKEEMDRGETWQNTAFDAFRRGLQAPSVDL